MKDKGFPIVRINYDAEIERFSGRNQLLVALLPKLNDAMDKSFVQVCTKTNDHLAIVVHMLLRLTLRHYEAIFHLASTGHGFSANRILRSMFEKYVDAHYIHLNPEQVADFWDYHLFTLEKEWGVKKLKEMDSDYRSKLKKYYTTRPKTGRKIKRSRWSEANLVEKAKAIGLDQIIEHAYRRPNAFVHSSVTEIIASFYLEDDDSISPASESTDAERAYADATMKIATPIAHGALKLLNEHFSLSEPPELDIFFNEYREGLKNSDNSIEQ